MLRAFLFLVITISLSLSAQAQSLEFETLRTESTPGFFALKIFPGGDMTPVSVQNIYITTFKDPAEANTYQPIIDLLTDINALIDTEQNAARYLYDANYRVIALGTKANLGALQFTPTSDDVLIDFTRFSDENLRNIYLKNLNFEFGGNISEVYPSHITHLGDSAVIYGKFEAPIKTRIMLSATSADGAIEADTPIYLNDYFDVGDNYLLADDWEAAYREAQPKQANHSPAVHSDLWVNIFPWILFISGALMIVMASVQIFRVGKPTLEKLTKEAEESQKLKIDEDWLHQPIEELPLYKAWDKDLPFEVTERSES